MKQQRTPVGNTLRKAFEKHLETWLGSVAARYTGRDSEGQDLPWEVLEFPRQPWRGATTYATVGLGETPFADTDGEDLRHELLFEVGEYFAGEETIFLVFHVAEMLRRHGRVISLGSYMDLEGPISTGASVEGFFFYDPIHFADELTVAEIGDPPTVIVWMVPITRSEIEFLERRGPEAFDDLMAEQDPDVFDLSRPSLELPG